MEDMNDFPEPPVSLQPAAVLPHIPKDETTSVDGQGMWRAWTRVFEKPESACLDLLDNCFDATLHTGFHGKIVMRSMKETETGIVIINNSARPIQSLDEALTVYKSSKNDGAEEFEMDDLDATSRKDAIGENGVGLKHGCATLSDTSFVLTRNQDQVEVGVVAKALQSPNGVYLPSFTFNIANPKKLEDMIFLLEHAANDHVKDVLSKALGRGNRRAGIKKLAQQIQSMFEGMFQNDQHVFQLVLCDLHHSKKIVIDVDSDGPPLKASKVFLEDIEALIPEHYINIPSEGFDFFIDGKRIGFAYWQKRLVELTEFRVNIPKEKSIEKMPDLSDWFDFGYNLKIFCGFDAQRVKKGKQGGGTSCKLYIYSRQAGRLIEVDNDARFSLNLNAQGTEYMQGLTIILADIESELPLMPTKDGIAWTEQKCGHIHKSNLFAWAGAVAACYWNYHKNRLKKSKNPKELLTKILASFTNEQMTDGNAVGQIAGGDFTTFEGVKWNKRIKPNTDKLVISRSSHTKGFVHQVGEDTVFRITDDLIRQADDAMVEDKRLRREKRAGIAAKRAQRSPARKERDAYSPPAPAAAAAPAANVARHRAQAAPARAEPDSTVSLIGLKRTRGSVNYCENDNSDDDIHDNDLIFVTPRKGSPQQRIARNDDDGMQQRLIEKDIQIREEQLKTLKAERNAEEAWKQVKKEERYSRKLRAKYERLKNRKPSPESDSQHDVANLREQLRRTAKERDEFKGRVEELERLAATSGSHNNRNTGKPAHISWGLKDVEQI